MIIRILGEGQFTVDDGIVDGLNELDAKVEHAIEAGDDDAFRSAMTGLLEAVRAAGTPVPDNEIIDSQLILPPADASLDEVAAILGDEGLIPG